MSHLKGSCLCGAVEYRVKNEFKRFFMCHCTQCQKATGSAHASNLFAVPDNLEWVRGEERVKRFDLPGRALSKAFCTECGSGVPYTSRASGMWVVPAGSLDGEPSMTPMANIFWPERGRWYEAGLEAPRFDQFMK